jgi:D-alanyl-D-alanine carboxypeptidase
MIRCMIDDLLTSARVPGCSVAVVDRTGVVWARAFGYADVEEAREAERSTVYHLFSGTKLFTATAILQLVEQGKLDLDASAGTYLPELPALREIPLRSLLSHVSGLRDTLRGFLSVYFPGEDPPSTSSALAGYDVRASLPPERKVQYRNVDYAILGEVVSRVSRLPYRDYVRRHILAPLSSDAEFDVSGFDRRRLATGYLNRWDPSRALLRVLLPSVSQRVYRGAAKHARVALNEYNLSSASIGGLVGSVDSFAPFLQSQLNRGTPLLSAAMTERMQSLRVRGRAGIASKLGVGLGWKIGQVGETRFVNHEGSGAGFTTELRLYPDEGLGMVVLMNLSSFGKTMRLAHRICEHIRANRDALD